MNSYTEVKEIASLIGFNRPMQPKIIIVEDEAITAMDLKMELEMMGFKVVSTVSNGIEAIQKTKELRPDLVLMDIIIKGEMNGIEAASQIIADLDIPIIFTTAYSDSTTLKKAQFTKTCGFINKPIEYNALKEVIESAIKKHSLINEVNKH
ncbi:response regulator [Methanobacterium sp.]|uniref:response regulator n=1 Tax=Methanobacterium sp. TaxID=2164 RepID=UPI003C76BF70